MQIYNKIRMFNAIKIIFNRANIFHKFPIYNKTLANIELKFLILIISLSSIFMLSPNNLDAAETITINIRVIHATSDPSYIDSGLRDLAKQLQSVFKYTSYQLLDSHTITIANNRTGTVPLPDNRTLEIVFGGVNGDRIKFTIRIFKHSSQVFTTQILLKNGSSVTIGGTDYSNGYLLFNISGLSN